MALNRDYLTKLADGGAAPSLWSYKTEDAATSVDAATYWTDAGDVLKLNDIIIRTTVTNLGASNEAWSSMGIHCVNARSGPTAGAYTVDVTNALAGPTIDSD